MSMVENSYLSLGAHGFHKIVYSEWGQGDNERVVVCVHGLTRNGRDFDFLCDVLQSDFRLACPDLPLGVEQVDWVGTSLGGLLGMMLAAQPNSPIRKLVVNDIGAFVQKAALQRLCGYLDRRNLAPVVRPHELGDGPRQR